MSAHWLSLGSPVIPALLECHLQHRVGGTVGLFPLAVDPDRVLGRQAERRLASSGERCNVPGSSPAEDR